MGRPPGDDRDWEREGAGDDPWQRQFGEWKCSFEMLPNEREAVAASSEETHMKGCGGSVSGRLARTTVQLEGVDVYRKREFSMEREQNG